jgi:hypothetical protein
MIHASGLAIAERRIVQRQPNWKFYPGDEVGAGVKPGKAQNEQMCSVLHPKSAAVCRTSLSR